MWLILFCHDKHIMALCLLASSFVNELPMANSYYDSLHYEKFPDDTVKCIENEIPFELPDGWEWARIASISSIVTDGEHKTPLRCNSFMGYYLLSARNIQNGYIILNDVDYVDEFEYNRISKRCNPKKNDVLISCSGSIGRIAVVSDDNKYVMVRSAAMVRALDLNPYYIMYVLQSEILQKQMNQLSKQTAQANLFQGAILTLLLPIPSLSEQERIVSKLNEIFTFINTIESDKSDFQTTIQLTKSKILDLAIRGKLVQQNPDDEHASVLLDRIRAVKEELIKQGKIKRDKKESVIFKGDDNSYYEKIGDTVTCIDEELPFELPDGWTWARLQTCCQKGIKRGKSPKYVDNSGTLVFAQKCNTKYDGINMDLALYLDEAMLVKYPDDEYMQDRDTVINSTGTGTLGRVGIYRKTDNRHDLPVVPDSHVTVIRAYNEISAEYVYYYLKAYQHELEKLGEGSTNQKELKPLTLKNLIVALPPYKEQEHIIRMITESFEIMSNIEKSLS